MTGGTTLEPPNHHTTGSLSTTPKLSEKMEEVCWYIILETPDVHKEVFDFD